MTLDRVFKYDSNQPVCPEVLGDPEFRRGQVFQPFTAVPRLHGGVLTWHVAVGISEVEEPGISKFLAAQRRLWGTRRHAPLAYALEDSIMATPTIGSLARIFGDDGRSPLRLDQRVDMFWLSEKSRMVAFGNPLTGQAVVL